MNDYFARRTESVALRARASRKRQAGYALAVPAVVGWPVNLMVADPTWSIAITAVQLCALGVQIVLVVAAARIDRRASKLMAGA